MLNVKWKIIETNFARDQVLVEYRVMDVPLLESRTWQFWITIPTKATDKTSYDITALRVFIDQNIPAQEITYLMHVDPVKTNENEVNELLNREAVVNIEGRIVTVVGGITSMPNLQQLPVRNNTIVA